VKLHNAGIIPRDVIYGYEISTKSQQLTRENDLLVAEIDAKVGGFGIVKADTAGAIVSSHYYLFEVNDGLDIDYLEQFIIAGGLERQVYALGTTNYAAIRADDVLAYHIPLPPIDEQRRIAEVLRDADTNIARVEGQIEAAQQVKRGVMQRLFMYGLAGDNEHWEKVRLGEIVEINPRRDNLGVSDDQPVSFLPMDAINEDGGGIAYIELRPYHEVSNGYTFFREGDILFAKITPCMENGKIAIVHGLSNGFGFGSTEYHVLRPSKDVNTYFLFSFISRRYFRQEATQYFMGSAGQQRVAREFLESYALSLPSIEEQCEIAAILSAHDATISNLQVEAAILREVKRGLMQKLLSGQARV
jgi:type I restriction enzyme, S subunit